MSDFGWDYPIFILVAIAAAAYTVHWLTRVSKVPTDSDFERQCPRCKLKTTGKTAREFLFCPFCANKYPPLP